MQTIEINNLIAYIRKHQYTINYCFFFSVHILTWNVSSKYPENLSVHKLLGLENKPENDTHRPDLYVIG